MKFTRIAVLLAVGGAAMSAADQASSQSHGHSHKHGHSHSSAPLEVEAATAPRIVEVKVAKDSVGGYNLYIKTENFVFAPELVNEGHAPGKGHAHIYIDGVKISRLYGPAFHIDKLAAGTRRIDVTLNANDHREYAVGGKKVSASAIVAVP